MERDRIAWTMTAFLIFVLFGFSWAQWSEDPAHPVREGRIGDSSAIFIDSASLGDLELEERDEIRAFDKAASGMGYLRAGPSGGSVAVSPRAVTETRILFDISHGFAVAPWDTTGWSGLINMLRGVGYTVVANQPNFDLAGYDVVFLSVPDSDYSAPELSAIQDFVSNGGGLVISAEWGGDYGTEYLNNVAGMFGVTFDSNSVHDDVHNDQGHSYWPIISNFASHPTTVGINQAVIYAGSGMDLTTPAYAVATGDTSSYTSTDKGPRWTDGACSGRTDFEAMLGDTLSGKPIAMAASEFGSGRVWAIGDHNIWADDINFWFIGIEYYDNKELALRVFGWVSQTGTSWLEWSSPYVAGWNLISLPCQPLDPDPDSVFGDDVAAYFLWGYDDCGYFPPEEVNSYGEGSWLGLLADDTVHVEGILCLPTDGPICIPLDACWNLIGDPFWTCVDWSRTRVFRDGDTVGLATAVSNGWVFDLLYGYRSGGYVFDATLCPGIGDWFPALVSGCELCVYPQALLSPPGSRGSDVMRSIPHPGRESWLLNVTASLGARTTDSLSVFGMSNLASDGFDPAFDFPEPPEVPSAVKPERHIRLYFPHPEWRVATGRYFNWDIRDPLEMGEEHVWNLEIETNRPGSVVKLTWKTIRGEAPEGHVLRLIDLDDGGTERDMLRTTSMDFTSSHSGEPRHFVIIATRVSGEASTSTPRSCKLMQNYPNPFNPVTEIKYQIPQTGRVRLSIYNVAGRLVRTIVDAYQQAGSHAVLWDGLNSYGDEVSSGVYFYKLTTADYEMAKKMVLLR